ncbi:MAG: class I SAM-dependent methyltransferase [Planctomycetota bacterium]
MDSSATCPRCFHAPLEPARCPACGLSFDRRAGVLDVLGRVERETRAQEVEAFYSVSPFPGYPASETAGSLLDRSRRAPFLRALDAALPSDARVVDIGAGTSQLAAFLALAAPRRQVFAVDGCAASLLCADAFRARVGIPNLTLVRADIFDLPLAPGSFAYVISRGVVHHTPDPDEATRRVARCVAPGGTLMLGFYETWARAFHCTRRTLGRIVGKPIAALDPLLRARDMDPDKRRVWIDDQYRHPLEHILALPRVRRVLAEQDFEWVRSVPPLSAGLERVEGGASGAPRGLFRAEPAPGKLAETALRTGWMLAGPRDPDAGLVCVIARRQART